MAYDKVIDSSVLDANLTSVADAIREKAGSSDTFSFPAGFVEAIAGIETGGLAIAQGTITPSEQITVSTSAQLTIEHNLGVTPFAIILTASSNPSVTSGLIDLIGLNSEIPLGLYNSMWKNNIYVLGSGSGRYTRYRLGGQTSNRSAWSEKTLVVPLEGAGSATLYLEAGKTYEWVVIG